MNTSDLKSFHYLESGEIAFSVLSTEKTTTKLDPGFYLVDYISTYNKETVTLHKDKYNEKVKEPIYFADKALIDNYVKQFCDVDILSTVNKAGFYHKGGVLLHGQEGVGKSSIIRYYCDKLVTDMGAIVFTLPNLRYFDKIWEFVSKVRSIQLNPIIIVMDEFDRLFGGPDSRIGEGAIKSAIDGPTSVNNCMFFASTNYIDYIPNTIKDRPSRFKYCLEVKGIDDVSVIKQILSSTLRDFVSENAIGDLSIHLRGNTLDEIKHAALDKLMTITSGKQEKQQIGFKI